MNLLPVAKLTLAAFLLAPFAAQAQEPAAQRVRTAQLFNRPPAGVQGDSYQGGAGDSAGLLVRIDRLEKEVRSLTGQLEQMQFQTRRLEEQLRRSQGQGESDGGGRSAAPPQRRGETLDAAPMGAQQAAGPQPGATPRGRGDAFDPSQSTAPGPRVLGQIDGRGVALPGGPLGGVIDEGDDPAAPMDLLNPRRPRASAPLPAEPPRTQAGLQPQPQTPGVDGAPSSIPPPGPRTDFEAAVAALRNSQLDVAETGFKDFLQRYPQSQLVASATFNLGDVYARRGRHREAAEQFLKVSTDYSKASQAPMSLLKLGESLERLGAKEQACAAWGEIGRKYPGASAAVKAGVERDMKRVQC